MVALHARGGFRTFETNIFICTQTTSTVLNLGGVVALQVVPRNKATTYKIWGVSDVPALLTATLCKKITEEKKSLLGTFALFREGRKRWERSKRRTD